MVDDGVEIGLEPAHALVVRVVAAQHVEEVRRVPEVAPRCERLGAAAQPPERGNHRRELRHDRSGIVRSQRDCAGGDAQRIHRIDAPLSAFAQQRERRRRQRPLGGEPGTKCFQLPRRRQRAVPQQPRRLLEARVRRELADRVAGDDQLTALTIDIAQPRRRGNDALEPAVDHV